MKLFKCQHCNQLLYFENVQCLRCESSVGYDYAQNQMRTLASTPDDRWQPIDALNQGQKPAPTYVYCDNHTLDSCNWLIEPEKEKQGEIANVYCVACQLNRTIPDLNWNNNLDLWRKLEIAKHRLVYSLLRLDLPLISKTDDPEHGLAFDFLADESGASDQNVSNQSDGKVTTGHANGVITINVNEADDAKREQMRQSLAEPYRTLLGHFRHECAHYYWNYFAQDAEWLHSFQNLFGDHNQDYAQALSQHYDQQNDLSTPDGSMNSWQKNYISAYASAHPWEDWAETWAHYLHIIDTLETAYTFGLQLDPALQTDNKVSAEVDFDAYNQKDFDKLVETWIPVTFAVNSLNRAMGQPDLYPFVLTKDVLEKMRFVHNSIHTNKEESLNQGKSSWFRRKVSTLRRTI